MSFTTPIRPRPIRLRIRHITALILFAALALAFFFVGQQLVSAKQARSATQLTAHTQPAVSQAQAEHAKQVAQFEATEHLNQVAQFEATEHLNQVAQFEATEYADQVAAQQAANANAQREAAESAPSTSSSSTSAPATSEDNSGGWSAVADCEEGGSDNPEYGYYGIKEWNGYDGYSSAGAAPQSVQLQWEEQNVGSPPNESGGCHSY